MYKQGDVYDTLSDMSCAVHILLRFHELSRENHIQKGQYAMSY